MKSVMGSPSTAQPTFKFRDWALLIGLTEALSFGVNRQLANCTAVLALMRLFLSTYWGLVDLPGGLGMIWEFPRSVGPLAETFVLRLLHRMGRPSLVLSRI